MKPIEHSGDQQRQAMTKSERERARKVRRDARRCSECGEKGCRLMCPHTFHGIAEALNLPERFEVRPVSEEHAEAAAAMQSFLDDNPGMMLEIARRADHAMMTGTLPGLGFRQHGKTASTYAMIEATKCEGQPDAWCVRRDDAEYKFCGRAYPRPEGAE